MAQEKSMGFVVLQNSCYFRCFTSMYTYANSTSILLLIEDLYEQNSSAKHATLCILIRFLCNHAYTYKCCRLLLGVYLIISSFLVLSLSKWSEREAVALLYFNKILLTRLLTSFIETFIHSVEVMYTNANSEHDSGSQHKLHYFVFAIRIYECAAVLTRTYTRVTTNEIQICDWSHGEKESGQNELMERNITHQV